MTYIHPARSIPFEELFNSLELLKEAKLIDSRDAGPLRQYTYSRQCVFDRVWNDISLLARGLILNPRDKKVVATPFVKFFNLGEGTEPIPNEKFHTYEKVDGSLIIAFHDGNYWTCATKGSFTSDQAYWAMKKLSDYGVQKLDIGTTYLFEAVYSANKIVVSYSYEDLVLLGAYDPNGIEYTYDRLFITAERIGCRIMRRYEFDDPATMVDYAGMMTKDEEGFVLHWSNGHRLKVKGVEYLKIHRAISGLTPLEVWRRMRDGENMETYRKHLPEELWSEFDQIEAALLDKYVEINTKAKDAVYAWRHISDKELGLRLQTIDLSVAKLIFPMRRGKDVTIDERLRHTIYDLFRPTGNHLDGYTQSDKLSTIQEDLA